MNRKISGIFTAGYGAAWFLGSAAEGFLADVSIPAIAFSVAAELLALSFSLKGAQPV